VHNEFDDDLIDAYISSYVTPPNNPKKLDSDPDASYSSNILLYPRIREATMNQDCSHCSSTINIGDLIKRLVSKVLGDITNAIPTIYHVSWANTRSQRLIVLIHQVHPVKLTHQRV